ncbi:MAG: hypothetical protein NTU58_01615 [Candidatus Nealsonbacteria bacterium]|nr:hypothetical protein [Candidatus Nealsonbacteria bacterium]
MDLISKILMVVLIFLGESFSIYAEMIMAKNYSNTSFIGLFLKMVFVIIIAGIFLIAGYMFGFKYFKNIWIVSVTSITSILIMEPILAYTIFHQLPTKGALIGLILGALGFISAIIYR